ncbi:MAG: hypothetical protein AB8G22_14085 [Saprospiraceae bacterium]
MKKFNPSYCLLLLSLLLFNSITHAQFGDKLKNKLKEKTAKVTAKKVKLDFSSSPFSPAITMHSLLSDGVQMTVDGKLSTKNLLVNFLPPKTAKGAQANYDEFKKENLLLTSDLVNTTTDKTIGQFHYSVNSASKVDAYMNQKPVNDDGDFFHKIGAGQYTLKFYAGGEHFYTFPFEVVAIKNDDPYGAFSEVLFLKGAWEQWNYFDVQETAGKEIMVWHHFMDNTTTDIENEFRTESNCDYKFRYELLRNGKVFGVHDSRMSGSKGERYNKTVDYANQSARRTHWVDQGVQLSRIPGDPKNWDKLELKDFTDGNYEMHVYTVDCAKNELKRSFPFSVKNGKFVYHAQQNRKMHSDAKTIVEGGREQYWFKAK